MPGLAPSRVGGTEGAEGRTPNLSASRALTPVPSPVRRLPAETVLASSRYTVRLNRRFTHRRLLGTAKGVDGTTNVPGSFTYTYTPPGNSSAPVNASATPYSVSAAFTSSDSNYDNGTPANHSTTLKRIKS